MITPEFELILEQEALTTYQAESLMNFLISEMSNDALRASFLAAMFVKGVTSDELLGFARSLRERAFVKRVPGLTDIVGTGGDHKNTLNVSTASAIVAASLGVRIGKHGNYASTGIHGSADFLKKIGYNFAMTQNGILSNINSKSFVFILANHYNEHFMKFSSVRRKLGFSSVLNYLGPLTNPLDPDYTVIGCTNMEAARMYADSIKKSGKTGCVVTAEDGMDEISPLSPTTMLMINGKESELTIYPSELDLDGIDISEISSRDPDRIYRMTLEGIEGKNEKASRFIAANAAPVLLLHGRGHTVRECYEEALNAIRDRKAARKMAELGVGR